MKIQIVRFEDGKYGARIKRFFEKDEYLSTQNPGRYQFTSNNHIRENCMFDSNKDARNAAQKYIEEHILNKKKLNVEVIEEIYF